MQLANLVENQTAEITNLMKDWRQVIYRKYFARYADITAEDLVVELTGKRESQCIKLEFPVAGQTITLCSDTIKPISLLDQVLNTASEATRYEEYCLNGILKTTVTGAEHLCTESWVVRASLYTLQSVIIPPESLGVHLYRLLDDESVSAAEEV
jgi:hypothetical protein